MVSRWYPDDGYSRSLLSKARFGPKKRSKLEDLTVKKRSPDLLNVKVGQVQLKLIIERYFVLPYMGMAAIFAKCPKTI